MKKYWIQVFWIVVLLYFSPVIAYGSIKELWKGDFGDEIREIFAIDINNNSIKEILLIHNEANKKLSIMERDKDSFKKRFQFHEPKYTLHFRYYDFNNLLLVEKFSLNEKKQFYTLSYKNGEYALTKIEDAQIPLWQTGKYITSGSFKKRDAKDMIVTTNIITSGMKPEGHLYLSVDMRPYNILWTSPFTIYNYRVVPLFGDFDKDKKIELLVTTDDRKNYWIYQEKDEFKVKEVKGHVKLNDRLTVPLFPLSSYTPEEKHLKAGRTTSKDYDEIFFIFEHFYGGPLFKAVWRKDRFESQMIFPVGRPLIDKVAIGYNNLNLADIDNDGLDEIIVSEIRGDLVREEEEPYLENRRDVIHILKWDGKKYKKIWTSKSLGLITQIIVDDVTGDGKKEIIVGNDKGEIHIFSQE